MVKIVGQTPELVVVSFLSRNEMVQMFEEKKLRLSQEIVTGMRITNGEIQYIVKYISRNPKTKCLEIHGSSTPAKVEHQDGLVMNRALRTIIRSSDPPRRHHARKATCGCKDVPVIATAMAKTLGELSEEVVRVLR